MQDCTWLTISYRYISYRQSYSHHPSKKPRFLGPSPNGFPDNASAVPEERRGLMSPGAFDDNDGDTVIEMDLLPPRWLDISDEVTDLLADIARKSVKLDKLHQKHVLPGFDDEHVRREEEGEIEKLTVDITRGFHACQRSIQRIESMIRDSKQQPGGVSKGEETMAKNLQISLAGRVQEASAGFRKKQSAYLKKLRGIGGMTPPLDRSSTPHQNPYSDPSMLESDADKSYSQSTLQQTTMKLTSNDATIMQREREITDIAKGIIELADIFKELQNMVIDQGTLLDRIDFNIETMAVNLKEADVELTKASGYQRRTAKRKIILLLILLVIGMVILVAVKPKRHSQPPPKEQAKPIDPAADRVKPATAAEDAWSEIDGAPNMFGSDVSRREWRRRRRRNNRRPISAGAF
ncbi:hypothetical protein GP486_001443 [Trichoglossum hirsutum]|uniref:t-SNARE coiled-coil homology domain-containing protein n=1 Tax=Trichoglossum hirsutum TaxID=265104 RepID=A0A9P8LG25_9PEZI|nr:hypothetical protein GP486_001443 [Trichoglossum hirsutum]